MSTFERSIAYEPMSPSTFAGIRAFLQRWNNGAATEVLTETQMALPLPAGVSAFTVLVTPGLTVLLLKKSGIFHEQTQSYEIALSFDEAVVKNFLQDLILHFTQIVESDSSLQHQIPSALSQLKQLQQQVQGSSSHHQTQFLLSLAEDLSHSNALSSRPVTTEMSENHLHDQFRARNLLLNQVIERIQQNWNLADILDKTLEEVRDFLSVDRLLLYQLKPPPNASNSPAFLTNGKTPNTAPLQSSIQPNQGIGQVTYEACKSKEILSVLHLADEQCVQPQVNATKRYQPGQTIAIVDIVEYYQHSPCLIELLQKFQVKSSLINPIFVQGSLWGLLIAHQCEQQRHWHGWEQQFLPHVGNHLAIAIHQMQLYQQLQQQQETLALEVTERTRDLQDALVAAEAANQTKSEFLATMSHELRTPLTYIIGMSATLLRWSFGELSPRQRDYLNTIHRSGEQLLEVINDILEVAKIESGRTALEVSKFSLTTLARSSLERFREQALKASIELKLDLKIAPDNDLFVADLRRLRQILANLLSNAVKFTPQGGRISLRVWRETQNAIFQVEDTGIGIPESQQPLLFQKFRQLETARQRQYAGTGLGLALTKQLVELHNGSIQVVSKSGKGSMFTVRIPLQRLSGQAAEDLPLTTPAEPITGRIVLLEDDESDASLICDMLTAADYQVIWLIEGSRIAHQVEILQPVIIIINRNLVSNDSQHILEDLKRQIATAGIKVLALLEDDRPETIETAQFLGFDEIIFKPLQPDSILQKVQALSSEGNRGVGE